MRVIPAHLSTATSGSGFYGYDLTTGTVYSDGSSGSPYTALTHRQTAMVAIDLAAGKMWVGQGGTWFNSGNPAAGTGAVLTGIPSSAHFIIAQDDSGAVNRD